MSAQSGESFSAVLSSPFVSAFSIVCNVSENAVPRALSESEIVVIALGRSVTLVTPCAVSWIWAVSASSVVDNVSSALFTSWPESVSGAPRALSESTSCCVEVRASSAADASPSCERFDVSVNCCVMLCRSSVQVVTALQKPLAQDAVGSAVVSSSLPPPQSAATPASATTSSAAVHVRRIGGNLAGPRCDEGKDRHGDPCDEFAEAVARRGRLVRPHHPERRTRTEQRRTNEEPRSSPVPARRHQYHLIGFEPPRGP